jgi:hypothetical protein
MLNFKPGDNFFVHAENCGDGSSKMLHKICKKTQNDV